MEPWREELYHSELYHYGVKRRSGRYPYGSGERPFQSSGGLGGLFKRKGKAKPKVNPKIKAKSKAETGKAPAEQKEEMKNSRTKAKEAASKATKEEAMKNMSPTQLHAVRRQLSDEELNRAVSRVKNEQTLEAQSENELRRHTSSSRSAIDAYAHRREISDADLETLNKRLQEEQKLRDFKNAEVERGKTFIKTLDKLDTYINKGLNYYNTYKRVEKIFSDIDNAEKSRKAAEKEAKQQKKEEHKQKREEKAERRAEKQREREDRLAREAAINAFAKERYTGTVEGEGRSRTTARDKYAYDVDYESYTPDERTTRFIGSNSTTALALTRRRRR